MIPHSFGEYSWVNTTPSTINYLIITNNTNAIYEGDEGLTNAGCYIDNVVVKQDCGNELIIASSIIESCVQEQITINYEVCLTGTDTGARDVELSLELPEYPGLVFGDGDFQSDLYTIQEIVPNGECKMLSLVLDISNSTLIAGNELEFTLTAVAVGSCIEGPIVTNLVLESCCPIPEVSFTHTLDDCGQTTFNIETLQVGDSYIIDYGDGTPALTGGDLNYTYLIDGNYTASVIVTNDCGTSLTITNDVTVEINQGDPSFTITENCTLATITITANDTQGYFEWRYNGTTQIGNIVTFMHPGNGTYTLDYVYINACTHETSTTIDLTQCGVLAFSCPCTGTNAINIDAGEGVSIMETDLAQYITTTADGNALDLTNRCVAISGRLIIGDLLGSNQIDLILYSDKIQMQPGAEIVIAANTSVDFLGNGTSSAFVGCEEMWRGISLETASRLKIRGYTIEDAQTAVQTIDKTSLEIASNQFSKNYIGIAYSGTDGTDLNITGNTFDGEPNLLPPFDDNLGIQSKSWLGIYLNKSNEIGIPMAIGSESAATNTFINLRLGLFAEGNIDLMMANNEFEHIRSTPTVNYQNEGYGVFVKGNGASLLDFNGNTGSGFNNCQIGIYAEKTDVHIYDAHMNCNRRGIEVVLSSAEINIHDNTINVPSFGTGINLLHNDGADDILVEDNSITVSSPPNAQNRGAGYGIAIHESTNRPPSKNVHVLGNNIEMNTGFVNADFNSAGIFLNATNNVRVTNFNEISCATTDDVGILVNGSNTCQISSNQVTGLGQNGIGLKVQNTFSTAYSCNDFTALKTGADFVAGNAFGSYLYQNNFIAPMGNGLIYRNGLTINEQEHTLNKWTGAFNGFAALNENSDLAAIILQAYIIHSTLSPYWPPSISPEGGQQPWFNVEDTDELLAPCNELEILPPNCKSTKLDRRIASDLGLIGDFIASRRWAVERAAYKKLQCMDIPSLDLSIEDRDQLISFKYTAGNGQIGAYKSVKDGLIAIHSHEILLQADWTTAWKSKRNLLKDWFELHQRLDENSSTADWSLYFTSLEDLTDINGKLNIFWQDKQVASATKIDAANEVNEALLLDILPQDNEKAINAILLKRTLAGKFNFEDLEIKLLKEIASQCPLEGGVSVHIARSLYALVDADEVFDIDCSSIQALRNSSGQGDVSENAISEELNKQKTVDATELNLYPNPVDGQLSVSYNTTNDSYIQLINSFGEILLSKQLEAGNHEFNVDTSNFPSGLYFMQLYDGEGEVDSQKIIITH